MNKLKKFSYEFDDECKLAEVGDEYENTDHLEDPFYEFVDANEKREFHERVYERLWEISDYFTGEYTETTDEEFQEIWPIFFHHWYYNNVYICYSQEVLQMEIDDWKENMSPMAYNKWNYHWKNPYRLFRLVSRLDENIGTFRSIYSGRPYTLDERKTPMVMASCNNGRNWKIWNFILKEEVASDVFFKTLQRLSVKRILRKVSDEESKNSENKSLRNLDPVFDINNMSTEMANEYEELNIAHPEIAKGILDNNIAWFLNRSSNLGYMQNANDKKERLTTGENFKDLHGVSNIQYRNLKQLNAFGRLFAEFYPDKKLNFNLSNWGEAEGIPKDMDEDAMMGEDVDNIPENKEDDKEDDKDN